MILAVTGQIVLDALVLQVLVGVLLQIDHGEALEERQRRVHNARHVLALADELRALTHSLHEQKARQQGQRPAHQGYQYETGQIGAGLHGIGNGGGERAHKHPVVVGHLHHIGRARAGVALVGEGDRGAVAEGLLQLGTRDVARAVLFQVQVDGVVHVVAVGGRGMCHHRAVALDKVGVGLLVEDIGAQELLHGALAVGAADNADHLALEVQGRVEDHGQVVVEQRVVGGAHSRGTLHALQIVLAVGGVAFLPRVVEGATAGQGDGRVVELRVLGQLLDAVDVDIGHTLKRALVHGGQQLHLGLGVGHPLVDAAGRLLGGALEILGVLLRDTLVVHGDEQEERDDHQGQGDQGYENASASRFVICFHHAFVPLSKSSCDYRASGRRAQVPLCGRARLFVSRAAPR